MKGPASFEALICISNVFCFFAKPENNSQPCNIFFEKKFKWLDLLDDKDYFISCFTTNLDENFKSP